MYPTSEPLLSNIWLLKMIVRKPIRRVVLTVAVPAALLALPKPCGVKLTLSSYIACLP